MSLLCVWWSSWSFAGGPRLSAELRFPILPEVLASTIHRAIAIRRQSFWALWPDSGSSWEGPAYRGFPWIEVTLLLSAATLRLSILLHLWSAFEQIYGHFAFQGTYHIRNRNQYWNRRNKMNEVFLYTHFLNFTFFPCTQQFYIFFYQFFDFSFKDPKPVFWYPCNMLLTFRIY